MLSFGLLEGHKFESPVKAFLLFINYEIETNFYPVVSSDKFISYARKISK